MKRDQAIETLIALAPSLKRSVMRHKAKSNWGAIATLALDRTGNTAIADAIWSG
jgi:hypothetical protein